MRTRLLAVGLVLATAAGLAGGAANAAYVRIGNLVLTADGGFQPQTLPRRKRVPIRFQGHAEIRTTDGSLPPALRHVKLEFDRDGKLNTAGLPRCRPGQLEAVTVAEARRRCAGAIVGKGQVAAVLSLFGARLKVRSPLTIFNGPKVNGNPSAVAHAQTAIPIFQAYVVVAPIERRKGTYGYRTSFDVPVIAGGAGVLTDVRARMGRRYKAGGSERSYVTARCSDGILQTQGYFSFDDGNVVYGSVFKGCNVRR